MDVGCPPDVMHPQLEQLYKKFGTIDILVNNAGVSYRGEVKLVLFKSIFIFKGQNFQNDIEQSLDKIFLLLLKNCLGIHGKR